ncbi:GDSL-type esterase/lipase family protein [Paenibacillus spongiae]|uniref:GDSL-type esterase/lipase family protein n=1 Tax=Paenibacillus spongiae TaxID=2909671 RepID=A0ABY5S2B3_9BACL|nr:GDSL-type esterase/lipase family protein [Paenibacillus spongiae]UVI27799.1 GDSL-type esterase/lipase family protein [Paenibacillus spongiae]
MKEVPSGKLWRTIGITAVAATLLMLTGFGYAVKDMLWPQGETYIGESPAAPPPETGKLSASSEIHVTAIGDSLTKGTGDATGEGYVKQVMALLREKWDKPVSMTNNLAVNGMRADRLAELLRSDKGYEHAISQSNLILFSIGGNDLFHLATGTSASEATGEVDLDQLKAQLPSGIERFKAVIERIHEINPDAHVVYMGLYNPFYDIEELRDGSLTIQQWNQEAYAIMHQYPNMTLVPTFDLFENTIGTYMSSDHFHPNHDGYAQIAARIVQSLD